MKTPSMLPRSTAAARQLSLTFDSVRLRAMSSSERAAAVAQLAGLLMEAAGVAAGEHDDDER